MDVLKMIADERRRFADLVDSLTADQLATPSLCGAWTVKEVAGHLVSVVAGSDVVALKLLVLSGFRLHKANARLATLTARQPAARLAALLREHADNPFRPPIVGHPGALTDLQVHGQDIRRPLGLPHELRPDRLRVSLDFLTGGRAIGFTPKSRPAGLRFETTDLAWARGEGPLVRGAAEAVMLALAGRPAALADLDGDGVAILRGRLRAAA
ncbi:maleylpyruvate isomerase family mycothiol-dependent enzyme [Actinoplanes sp. NEAU-A12]|uniref:Maleylpyruvate isomerase family mycothiol-dependent enzyme n=1 Tax=Actinoplanes sandaracinus TaxID=3045177 RepID=A0ABT6WVR2_9ACTN|nr:maleylpyruvate isomerase family mycothiol-dependent enzyme [Actinoplanes sandaracinus]MDI6103789.1 maleylpyruvate isomerase family mycothiol-dependent enzyme [Actinoplanes sandaracinus]